MVDFNVRIVIDTRGAQGPIRRTQGQLQGIERGLGNIQRLAAQAFAFAGVGIGIGQLTRLADSFTETQNRLRIVTADTDQLALVTDELFNVARRTRSEFGATAELYSRVALASRDLGISQQETLDFTESLNQAIILSGATATEAQAGLIQLSQGLASGALRGDELRSVLEQLPVVADVIAQSLDVTRGELRELGAEGLITADIVINAFAEARGELEENFGRTIPTLGQAFTQLRTNITELVGGFTTATDITGTLTRVVLGLAENVETFARAIAAAAIALGVNFARQAIGSAIAGLGRLAIAIVTNPITTLGVVLTATIGLLVAFGDQLQLTAGSSATVLDFLVVAFMRFQNVFVSGLNFIASIFTGFQDDLGNFDFLAFVTSAARAIDVLIGVFEGGRDAILAVFEDFPRLLADIFIRAFNGIIRLTEEFTNDLIDLFGRIPGLSVDNFDVNIPLIQNNFRNAGDAVGRATLEGFQRGFSREIAVGFVASVAEEAEARAEIREREAAEREARLAAARAALTVAPPPALPTGDTVTEQNEALVQQAEALSNVAEQAENLGNVFDTAFRGATDAVVDFAQTGELSLREFFSSITEELLRLSTQQLFGQLLTFAFPQTGANLLGGLPGFQQGGSFMVGGSGAPDSQFVAFRASPGERVDVRTPAQQAQGAVAVPASPVNVTIVNQTDPNDTIAAMNTPQGTRVILNILEQNPQTVQRLLSR